MDSARCPRHHCPRRVLALPGLQPQLGLQRCQGPHCQAPTPAVPRSQWATRSGLVAPAVCRQPPAAERAAASVADLAARKAATAEAAEAAEASETAETAETAAPTTRRSAAATSAAVATAPTPEHLRQRLVRAEEAEQNSVATPLALIRAHRLRTSPSAQASPPVRPVGGPAPTLARMPRASPPSSPAAAPQPRAGCTTGPRSLSAGQPATAHFLSSWLVVSATSRPWQRRSASPRRWHRASCTSNRSSAPSSCPSGPAWRPT
mmetsp:Transcript_100780/g.283202  ORF Transcript_100780/g.283202 Transcript_100780/m.283202 type:complete len:263 (+) Transcript_100780:102-890(+)